MTDTTSVNRGLWPLPGRMADEFFLLAHRGDVDPIRPRLHESGLSLGLAAAILGELLLEEHITVRDERVILKEAHQLCDPFIQSVSQEVLSESSCLTVRTWLKQLSQAAPERVRSRLDLAGYLCEIEVRRWWGGRVTARRAQDPNQAIRIANRVYHLLVDRVPDIDSAVAPEDTSVIHGIMLAALIKDTGLEEQLARDDATTLAPDHLEHLRTRLPAPYRELLRQTAAAVAADTILGHRRGSVR